MNVKEFYKHSSKEIVDLFRDFIEKDCFSQYPELKDKLSFVLTGSVPSNHYDRYSDIDCDLLFENESDRVMIKEAVKKYKMSLREQKLPIQLHSPMTFSELENSLTNWNHDSALREHSAALVVLDPRDRYKTVQSQIKWYPREVLQEKIQWLFAESVFSFEDRLVVAVERENDLYVRSLSLQIVKLLANALIMINDRYPVFEKHIYSNLRDLGENEFCAQIDLLLNMTETHEIQKSIADIIDTIEQRLIKTGFIEKQPKEHWIQLRPRFQVEGCA